MSIIEVQDYYGEGEWEWILNQQWSIFSAFTEDLEEIQAKVSSTNYTAEQHNVVDEPPLFFEDLKDLKVDLKDLEDLKEE